MALKEFLSHNADGTEPQRPLTAEDFNDMLKSIYRDGGSPDLVYLPEDSVDRLYHSGRISRREYAWLKLKFSAGRLKRSVISGVRSVLRITGTESTE